MLSDKAIEQIEKALGIQGVKEMIASEHVIEIEPKKTKHFSDADYDQLHENLTKQGLTKEKYNEAILAGEEMAVKNLKRDNNLEFEGKSVNNLYEFLNRQIKLKSETDSNKIKAEYEKDIENLRKTISEKEKEIQLITGKVKADKIDYLINNEFNGLQLEIPAHIKDEKEIANFIKFEKERNKTYFKSLYEFDIENDRLLVKKDGQIIKDELQNPANIGKLVQDYASSSYMNLKIEKKGRGEGDRLPVNNVKEFKSLDELKEYAKTKGIMPGTSAFDAIHIEWQKNQ